MSKYVSKKGSSKCIFHVPTIICGGCYSKRGTYQSRRNNEEGGGTNDDHPPPSVNPISIRGADYVHHITTPSRIFRPSYGPAFVFWGNLMHATLIKHYIHICTNDFPTVPYN